MHHGLNILDNKEEGEMLPKKEVCDPKWENNLQPVMLINK